MNDRIDPRELSAYHDNELPRDEAERVAAHVRTCPACQAELARLRAVSRAVQSLSFPRLPDAAMARLDAIDEGGAWKPLYRTVSHVCMAMSVLFIVTCAGLLHALAGPAPLSAPGREWEAAAVSSDEDWTAWERPEFPVARWVVSDLGME
jgi:anti-sigma factor RsiW